ncbi:hypothetical protein [Mycoplasmopsis agalactiae]|uniref:hypothetical protein n=1 Tax=Mycoplasmopsis agalactiae TaxID=2110 RepID=UPI001F288131|nr:hypothetical protein [Mycoplasmopsis agalactiae]
MSYFVYVSKWSKPTSIASPNDEDPWPKAVQVITGYEEFHPTILSISSLLIA